MSQSQLAKEERVGFKSPITMAAIGVSVLIFFGILGREGETVFEISRRMDVIQLPSFPVGSSTLGWVSGILLLIIAGYSLSFALKISGHRCGYLFSTELLAASPCLVG